MFRIVFKFKWCLFLTGLSETLHWLQEYMHTLDIFSIYLQLKRPFTVISLFLVWITSTLQYMMTNRIISSLTYFNCAYSVLFSTGITSAVLQKRSLIQNLTIEFLIVEMWFGRLEMYNRFLDCSGWHFKRVLVNCSYYILMKYTRCCSS